MSAVAHATATRSPEPAKAKARPEGDCCAAEAAPEAGLPRFLGGLQPKLQVGAPDDPLEREADAVAAAVQRGGPVRPIRAADAAPRFQRLCADCAEKRLGTADGPAPSIVRRMTGAPGRGAPRGTDTTSGLPAPVRGRLEHSLAADLAGVQVHTGPTANRLATALGARAFTHRNRIWLGAGERADDLGLMAHEVTHVLQQGAATPAADASGGDGAPVRLRTDAAPRVQRTEKDAIDRALDWGSARLDDATSAVASGTEAAGEFVGEQLMTLLRKVAPRVAEIIDEGPLNFAKRKINEALEAHLPAALGGFSFSELIDGVAGWLGDAAAFAKGLLKGDAKSCAAFAAVVEKLTGFVTKLIDNPVVEAFTTTLTQAWDFVGKAVKFVAEPVFDGIARQVSGAWSVLKTVASTVSGWISSAKEALGAAWDQLVELLGFDGSSEDGAWAYIKGVGNDLWETIKAEMAPVVEPLKKVAAALSLVSPMGQIHAIVEYGPKVVKVAQWVWENGLDPAKIREAPEEIRGMLESLTGGVDGFKGVLQSGLDWLSGKLSGLADAVLEVVGAITGLPLIGFAHDLFDEAKKSLKTLVADIEKGARDALAAIEAAAKRIMDFLAPYKEVISSLILAIASPVLIPVILAGWAWRALPACVKIPILNFILDIAIAALNAIPEVPTFGVLWPLLKPGVMAFLGTLRAADDAVKEQVSDKIAKVLSGASPEFLIGFVKGFAVGVWEGITDPLKAIWMVLEGLDTATQYLLSLAGVGEEKAATAPAAGERALAAAPSAATAPTPTGATGAAAPSTATLRRAGGAGGGEIAAASRPAPAAAAQPSAPGGTASGAGGGATSVPPEPARRTITAVAPPAPAPVSAAPAAVATPAAEPEFEADAAAALTSGAPMPESTRKLLERLAAQQAEQRRNAAAEATAEGEGAPEEVSVGAADLPALTARASAMAEEIGPDVETVQGGFWGAVQEYFSGEGMSFDDMVAKLSDAWESAKEKISEGGAWLANKLMGFFRGGGAEGELGDKVGWLSGTIAFQVLLDAITAGTWIAAGPVLKGIAKFINWPMEFLGQAFKLLKTLGRYLLDGLKKLGGVIKDAAAGAFKTVSKALGNIGERLLAFGEEIFGRFGGKAARAESKAAGALGREGAQLAERRAAQAAEREAAQAAEQRAAREAEREAAAGAGKKGEQRAQQRAERDAETRARSEAEAKAEGRAGQRRTAADREAAEKPLAAAEAQAIAATNDAVDTPVPLVRAQLLALKRQFGWIRDFEFIPNGVDSYEIWMIGSRTLVRRRYTVLVSGKFKSAYRDRPPPGRSELDVGDHLGAGWQPQAGHLHGRPLPAGAHPRGSTIPDWYNPHLNVSAEVKNWDLAMNYEYMIKDIKQQWSGRLISLPGGPKHWLFIELRGQNVGDLAQLAARIHSDLGSGAIYQQIHFILDGQIVRAI